MSEQLKVGDRVRVFADTPADNPIEKYLNYFDISELTGTVTRATKNGYIVRSDDGREEEFLGVCMELIERPRRTFEEIGKELGEKYKKEGWTVNLYQGYILMIRLHSEITIYDNGAIDISGFRATPAELTAISAACTEIAANYAAEHRKETK